MFPLHSMRACRCTCGKDCGRDAAKHPRTRNGVKDATTDRATIEQWWKRWPDANIGLATGAGLVILDLDSQVQFDQFASLAANHGGLPLAPVVQTGRGWHIYLAGDIGGSKTVDKILIRGAGGYCVAPPSVHANGHIYQWIQEAPIPQIPPWMQTWIETVGGTREKSNLSSLGPLPAYLQRDNNNATQINDRATKTPWSIQEQARIMSALAAIPASCDRETWLRIGMSLSDLNWVGGSEGGDLGFEIWAAWSATCPDKFSQHDVETRWKSFGRRTGISLGSLYHYATERGWTGNLPREYVEPKSQPNPKVNGNHVGPTLTPEAFTAPDPDSPLIELNDKFAAIGDVGGKCLVLGWATSKVDEQIRVPSFQTFKAFSERFAHRYVNVRKPKGGAGEWVEEPVQLGGHWLKWRQRRSYEGIDLVPTGDYERASRPSWDKVLPGNVLNLWTGFGVPAVAGNWDRMKEHIALVLARGNTDALVYILKWAAWAVQHPGEAAQAALVFRGAKGAGKGTFAHALRRIFGQHGLHVSHSKHMTGSFNAHLRQCLLLYADEAFWAGDKQGESTLKALITEPVMMIEQKGVDATQWKNRLHVVMTANAEWVVPASGDERRYAVFNVDESVKQNERYFDPLYHEMDNGGLGAMLYDLQRVELNGWHPRKIVQTEALQQQKVRSLDPRLEWFETLLQDGILPPSTKEQPSTIATPFLLDHARHSTPRLKDISATAIGLFLRSMGCVKMHMKGGNGWKFEPLREARGRWERKMGGSWAWDLQVAEWGNRN